jgi:hypothetical protein
MDSTEHGMTAAKRLKKVLLRFMGFQRPIKISCKLEG